ncbi:MAG: ABC transporter ATP-binding protein [Castellaniella sp.]|uniref:ABC transporter ATP-binding protein n=1 Tax=Castellaniella sp. TaxID=1955812 RepID=UPI002A364BF7|nr:ABC transporter ATP-binding protein [Castellaniella sp.]MDY0309633.1 ABC transporter ATP-binding protein [Castellaniella sp.]
MTGTAILQALDLTVGHGGRRVAGGLNLDVRTGEILCLLGPNGSGKTTLFKTLLGLLPPLSGRVLVDGQLMSDCSRAELARRVAYVPQAHVGVFPYTVEQIVLMGRAAHVGRFSLPSRADRRIAAASLDAVGLADLAGRRYTEISGGQRQLALIARALAQQADILIMDEPTASLDFGNQIRMLERIDRLKAQGVGVFLSTHQPDHALQIADRIAVIRDGVLHGPGPATTVATPSRLAWLYGLDAQTLERALSGAARARMEEPET